MIDELTQILSNEEAIAALLKTCEAERVARIKLMPDEATAMEMLYQAYLRLKELGWKSAMYCPADGKERHLFEAGSTAAGIGHREVRRCSHCKADNGNWFWMHDAGDWWPTTPILFKEKE